MWFDLWCVDSVLAQLWICLSAAFVFAFVEVGNDKSDDGDGDKCVWK